MEGNWYLWKIKLIYSGGEPFAPKSSILALSSDSESCKDSSLLREEKEFQFQGKEMDEDAALTGRDEKTSVKKVSKEKSPKKGKKSPKKEKDVLNNVKRKGNNDHEDAEEDIAEKQALLFMQAFVECEGESIDLSGDMGAVGRILVPGTAEGNHVMFLDLKGTIYKTTLVPSRSFCIVSFGHPEAKIGAIMNDFIQLKPHYAGTLDGFLFDLEDESDKLAKATPHQIDQNDGIEEQTNEKTKAKAGPAGKRGTTAGGEEMKHAMSVFCFLNPAYVMAVLVRC
ncbi:dna-binding protein bin4 [Citrus sinensis]|nr:dna-binding protein bin4 [Citrus sinensis]